MAVGRPLLALAMLLAGCGGGGEREGSGSPGPARGDDDKLVRHVDPRGFELSAPKGWRVATDAGLLITARSPDEARLVAIAPFLSPTAVSPERCLARAPLTFASLFPSARLGRLRPREGQALATLTFRTGARRGRATLLCALSGRAGVLYAIAAPSEDFAAARTPLVRILRTLRFTAPRQGRPVDTSLRYRSFRDGAEGAFSVEVPAGWTTDGGLIRRTALEVYPRVNAVAPGGRLRVFMGLRNPRTYALPNAAGVPEGADLPYAGATLRVARYVPGPRFARSLAGAAVGCEGARVLRAGARPGVSSAIVAAFRRVGLNVAYDVGDVRFACTNEPRRGYVVAATLLAENGAVGTWYVDRIFGYRSSAQAEEIAKAAVKRMIDSFRFDAEWQTRQQQTTAEVAAINRQTNEEISAIIESTYEQRQTVVNEAYRKWSNATLGQTDVRDATTGEQYKVQSGQNFYWRRVGTNDVTGTTTDDRPDIDLTPLEEL